MKEQVNVAVVGCGHLGRWHVQKARDLENSNLVAIIESEKGAAAAKKLYPEILVVTDVMSIIDKIDAVVLATPTSTHFSLIKFFREQGKHIFCEKPMVSNESEVRDLEKMFLPEVNNFKKIQIGHSERFHQIWDSLKEIVATKPCLIKIDRGSPFKGRASDVDVVQDLMVHDLDLVSFLLKELPLNITATGFKRVTDKWDEACAFLTYKSGHQVIINSSRDSLNETRLFSFQNCQGSIEVDLMNFQVKSSDIFKLPGEYEKRDHLLIEQDLFYKAILDDSKTVVDFEAGKNAVLLVDRVLQAINSKGETISFN